MIVILIIILVISGFGLIKTETHDTCLNKEYTDAIKGLFIIIVFYSHIIPYLTTAGVSFSPILDIPSNRFIQKTGQLMVVMFLFYSGYGVMESIQKKGELYIRSMPLKRILSTLANYAIAVTVFFIMNTIIGIHYSIKEYILSLIAWESVGQSNWYIFAIICCYLSSYLSFSVFKQKNYALASTVLLLLVYYIILHSLKNSWWYNTILAYPAGMLVSLNKKDVFCILERHYPLCFSGLLLLFILLFLYRNATPIYLTMSVIFAFLMFSATYKFVIKNKFLTWCGKNLFQIYVYQRIPMILLLNMFPDMTKMHPYIYVSCCFAVTLLFAYFIKPISFNYSKSSR